MARPVGLRRAGTGERTGADVATARFEAGDYRYLPGVFQYSAGVVAEPGFRIVRARFDRPVPLAEAYPTVEFLLAGNDRPPAAFCACELRSPAPFTEDGFREFNEAYARQLEVWGLLAAGANPVARSNVCPAVDPPPVPSMHAFCFTVPEEGDAPPDFVVAGSGEATEGKATYEEAIVALGDVSPAGIAAKAGFVLGEMERRLAGLGAGWADCSAVQLYTVHDAYPVVAGEIAARRAWGDGLAWHWCRPPVVGIEFEMDCRRVGSEVLLAGA